MLTVGGGIRVGPVTLAEGAASAAQHREGRSFSTREITFNYLPTEWRSEYLFGGWVVVGSVLLTHIESDEDREERGQREGGDKEIGVATGERERE